jgi:ADP-heptose:LPS heptosyltransferase
MLKQRLRLAMLRICGRVLRLNPRMRRQQRGSLRSVLVIRPDHLGDVLLSRPAIDRLVQALPGVRVVVAVGPWSRVALGTHSRFELLTCPFPGFSRAPAPPDHPYRLLLSFALLLRRQHTFDAALILRPDHWWGAWLAALAGIPVRLGYATPETSPFLTDAVAYTPGRHAAQEALDLVEAFLARPQLHGQVARVPAPTLASATTFADDVAATLLLRETGLATQSYAVLHPGSGARLKTWPAECFAELGCALIGSRQAERLVVTGSPDEAGQAAELCARLPAGTLNLAGQLTWGELEAVLRRARLVVGVDNGALHLAVVARTPSVALFGPADPAQFGPWGDDPARHAVVAADLPCRPCRRLDRCRLEPGMDRPPPCMRAIGVAEVLAACETVLAGGWQSGLVEARQPDTDTAPSVYGGNRRASRGGQDARGPGPASERSLGESHSPGGQ